MSQLHDPRVDACVDALPAWPQAIGHQVREITLGVDPELQETVKRTVQPCCVLPGNVCALLAARTHVNVLRPDGGITSDPDGITTGGHTSSTARTVAVHEGAAVPAEALSELLSRIVADNRAGGSRRLERLC